MTDVNRETTTDVTWHDWVPPIDVSGVPVERRHVSKVTGIVRETRNTERA